MGYSAEATVVALLRDMPKTLTLAGIGEALLDAGSTDRLWEEHVGSTLVTVPGTEPDRDAAARDVEQWTARGWRTLTVLDPDYPDRVRAARRPPALLMAAGQLAADAYSVAIVGSRKASADGIDFARGVPVLTFASIPWSLVRRPLPGGYGTPSRVVLHHSGHGHLQFDRRAHRRFGDRGEHRLRR